MDLVQRVQNHAARLITGNFDYMNGHAIELVKSLNVYTIRDRRGHFLTILMLKSIHGIAPTYLLDRVVMDFDVNGYDTRGSNMEYTPPRRVKRLIEIISCIWVANCGTIFPSLYKILQTLNHSNVSTLRLKLIHISKRGHRLVIKKCTNCWLALDWFSNFAIFSNLPGSVWWNECFLLSEYSIACYNLVLRP